MLDLVLEELRLGYKEVAPLDFFINLIFGVILGRVLRAFYIKIGKSFSNREILANNFVFLILIITLIITLIKTSVALSLGLVGALSIIRFRTPIKDPEELMYLFFAVSIGLGLGSNQRLGTIITFGVCLIYLFLQSRSKIRSQIDHSAYLNIQLKIVKESDKLLLEIQNTLGNLKIPNQIKRIDLDSNSFSALLLLTNVESSQQIRVLKDLNQLMPDAQLQWVDTAYTVGQG